MVKRLTIGIPTKDRVVELSLAIMSLLYQTYQDWDLIIYNDCHSDAMSNKTLNSIFNLVRASGHDLKIIPGEKRGPHIGGQKILETATTELILRLDDDVYLEQDAIQEMINIFDTYDRVGCVGPLYIDPALDIEKQWIPKDFPRSEIIEQCKVKWVGNELHLTGWAQTNMHSDKTPVPTEHLNSGFMYKREAGLKIGGYFLDLSIAGHREESDFTYRIFKHAGYNEFICPSAIAWHFHPMSGGIRETLGNFHAKSNWDHDEKLFLERMETWLPKAEVIKSNRFTSVIILCHGDHNNLRNVLTDIKTYTNHPHELVVINNDITEESKKDFTENISKEFSGMPIRLLQLSKRMAVGEARTLGVKYTNPESKYIIFLDDDARILGRYNQTTDWINYLYNRFHEVPECGAVSPIFTWLDELQCHCVSVACMFTSKRVWNIVGGFDPNFGNWEKGTWGWEDSDWSYRCESAGFKLAGVTVEDYPFYHHNTVNDHTHKWYTEGLLKAKDLLLSKYNIEEINKFCRTTYPFTKPQIESRGIKLNVGCYYMKIEDFINVDINPSVKPDICCNMLDIDKHFHPNSVQGILISQCLEHVSKEDGITTLTKFFNILKSGGWLTVEVPDGNDIEGRYKRGEISQSMYDLLMTGHKEVAYQGHDSIYSTRELMDILQRIGFANLIEMPLEMTSDKVEAIRIDCRKP